MSVHLRFGVSKNCSVMGPSDRKGAGRKILTIQGHTSTKQERKCSVVEVTQLVASDK